MLRNCLCAIALMTCWTASGVKAEEISLVIKSGETLELARLYWRSDDCKTLLKSNPIGEILDGPANLAIAVAEAKVIPRSQKCLTKPVQGGILSLTAKDVTEVKNAQLIVRIKYDTKEGPRIRSYSYDVVMVP
jgi:hypothetical protein